MRRILASTSLSPLDVNEFIYIYEVTIKFYQQRRAPINDIHTEIVFCEPDRSTPHHHIEKK